MTSFVKCTKSACCSNKDRHRGRCNRNLQNIGEEGTQISKIAKCTKSVCCSNKDRHRGRCNRNLQNVGEQGTQISKKIIKKNVSKKQQDDPWFVNVTDNEYNRLNLFGIRIEFTKKKRKRIESRKATVVNYLPATQEHIIKFDDSNKQFHVHLLREKNWKRIPWSNNVLDSTTKNGEISNDTYLSFGPDCPRCAAFLGVGAEAWSKCHICKLDEPGACLWSMHSIM